MPQKYQIFLERAIEAGYTQAQAEQFLDEKFISRAAEKGFSPKQAQQFLQNRKEPPIDIPTIDTNTVMKDEPITGFEPPPTTAAAPVTTRAETTITPRAIEVKPILNDVNEFVGGFNQAFNQSLEGLLVGQKNAASPLAQFWEQQKSGKDDVQALSVNIMRGITSLPLIPATIGEELLNAESPEGFARAITEMVNFPLKFGGSLIAASGFNPAIEIARLAGSQKAEEIKRESQQLIFQHPVETLLAAVMGRAFVRGGVKGLESIETFRQNFKQGKTGRETPKFEELPDNIKSEVTKFVEQKENVKNIEEWVKQASDENITSVLESPEVPTALKQLVQRFITKQQKGVGYTQPKSKISPEELAQEGAVFKMKPKGISRDPVGGEGIFQEVARRSEIVKDLSDILDVPIRTGKFRQKARGIYKSRPEVIRSKLANDIETVAHEVGHHIHKTLLEPGAKKLSEKPLEPFRKELEPIATKPAEGQPVLPEGFAEYIRLYITDRPAAKTKAPKFTKHFESILKEVPEVKDVLDRAETNYTRWIAQPATARVFSQISINEKPERGIGFDDIYTAAKDDLYPISQAVKDMVGKENIPYTKDPYKIARNFRGWWGKVDNFLKYGTRDFVTQKVVGKPYDEILNPIKDNLDNFRAYIVSKRAIEKESQGLPTGISKKDARTVIEEHGGPKFKRAFEELKRYQNESLQYLIDSGVVSPDAAAKMRQANQDYVPFYRVIETEAGPGTPNTFANLFNPVKRFQGSTRDIVDPLESILKNTYAYINIAERNRVGEALVRLAEERGGTGKYVEEIPRSRFPIKIKAKEVLDQFDLGDVSQNVSEQIATVFRPSIFTPKDEPIITVFRSGQRKLYSVDPSIHRAMLSLDRESSNMLVRLLAYPAKMLRAGATVAPGFMARNPFRDQFTALIQSKYGYKPFIDLTKGIFHAIKKDELYWDFKQSGAEHSMLVSMDRKYLQKNLEDVLSDNNIFIPEKMTANMIRHPIESLRMLSEFGETGTRIGEFQRALRQAKGRGKSNQEALAEAGFAAREVTLDFARMGTKTQSTNAIIAFFNAQLEGTDKMTRTFIDNPKSATAKAVAGITVPSVMLYFVNRDDPRYKDMPAWRKDLFWNIPGKNNYYSIPKPFTYGLLFGSFPERVLEYVDEKDPDVFNDWAENLFEGLMPQIIPTAAVPLIENFGNWSMFRDQPLVPRGLEDAEPEEQFSGYTSEVAKKLGRILNYPPAKIDNFIQGWTGGLGRLATEGVDKIFEETGIVELPPQPKRPIESFPVIRSFVRRYPNTSTKSMEEFYKQYAKTRKAVRTLNLLEKNEQIDRAEKYQEENATDLDLAQPLREVAESFSENRKMVQSISREESMTPKEKRMAIDEIYLFMTEDAREISEYIRGVKSKSQ